MLFSRQTKKYLRVRLNFNQALKRIFKEYSLVSTTKALLLQKHSNASQTSNIAHLLQPGGLKVLELLLKPNVWIGHSSADPHHLQRVLPRQIGRAHDVGDGDGDAARHPGEAVYQHVAAAQSRRVDEVVADREVLREVLIGRVRRHDAQVVLVLEPMDGIDQVGVMVVCYGLGILYGEIFFNFSKIVIVIIFAANFSFRKITSMIFVAKFYLLK